MKLSTDIVEGRMTRFAEVCRKKGIRTTHQRMEVFRELAGTTEHPDAEQVYRAVRERIPMISLDTVYRTLRLLEEKELVRKVKCIGDRTRYDANTDRHYHFVCERCGAVHDFYSHYLDAFETPPGVELPGQVDSLHVELRGVCNQCRE